MNRIVLISLLFIGGYWLSGCRQKPISEHEIVSDGAKHPGREWKQKEFFLSTFSAYPGDSADYSRTTATLKEAGFNYIETAWRNSPVTEAILLESDRQGMDVMAQDLDILGGFQGKTKPFHVDSVKKYLDLYGTHKSLKSVYISDEPIAEDNLIVRKNMDEFERVRPDLLGFAVLLPSYYAPYAWTGDTKMRFDEYVDKYIQEVNPAVLSTDYYPFQSPADTTTERFYKSLFWKDMGLFRDRALKNDMMHWFYYQTVQVNKNNPYIRPGYMNVQAWAAVMYGVKGLSTYTALNSVVDKKGEKEYLFSAQQKINQEIKALGNTLLCLKSTGVYHAEHATMPDDYANSPEKSVWLSEMPEHLSAGEFTDNESNTYILFLNKDFTKKHDFTVPLKDSFRIYSCDKTNGGKQSILHESVQQLPLSLDAGEGVLIRIEKPQAKPKLITYRIL